MTCRLCFCCQHSISSLGQSSSTLDCNFSQRFAVKLRSTVLLIDPGSPICGGVKNVHLAFTGALFYQVGLIETLASIYRLSKSVIEPLCPTV